ncbi:1-acyl-sn-glycerol-3-phosphate acyltransferase [Corynebacterium sp.]|uniref:lysophospholipid acyltransferase family protein n=1 Tax=Corynebacterium sp. TaxID=1720 RepID=UPI0026DCF6B0|nr:lysophospholipid acyltransferase family protein [Corynebacterium sp.]MDO5032975.1 lysophospholipid acyltransferase family protein [Corynebacterium sp.]
MSQLSNFLYRKITTIARAVTLAQGLKFRATGEEYIPATGGAVLVCNHTGYMDFVFGGFLPYRRKRLVRYLTKAGVFKVPVLGKVMTFLGHVPVDRIDGGESMQQAVRLAKQGELVGVFAEGTISRSFEIRRMRSGAARIAYEADVPIIPIVIFGSQRLWTKGHKKHLGRTNTPIFIKGLEPMRATGDADADTAEIRRRMQEALEGLWADYEAEFGPMPAGEYWVPARKGGGAPTLEEAEAQDLEVESERYRVRRLRDDLVGLKERVTEATTELVRDRLAITAKPHSGEVTRTASENLEWVKDNLNAVVEEATRGLDEGREKVTEIMNSLKMEIAEAQATMSASSKEIFAGSMVEQGLLAAATQSRLIVSRLPHRMKAHYSRIPRVLVADETALNYEVDALTSRLRGALNAIYPEAQVLVLMSAQEATRADSIFADVPQALWRVEHNGAVITQSGDVMAIHPIEPQRVAAIESAAAEGGLQVTWHREGEHVVSGVAVGTQDGVREALGEAADGLYLADDLHGVSITAATRAEAVDEICELLSAEREEAVAFVSEQADCCFVGEQGVVALETAPIELVKAAQSVTYSAERAGMAEVLEAMGRLQQKK